MLSLSYKYTLPENAEEISRKILDDVELYSEHTMKGGLIGMDKKIERQTLLLRLDGELDMRTAETLRQAIDHEIERRGIRTVVLNLEKVQFIDSSGLGVILGRYKKLLPLNGKIRICNVPPHIFRIMELSGLPRIIEFFPNEAAAKAGNEEGRGA